MGSQQKKQATNHVIYFVRYVHVFSSTSRLCSWNGRILEYHSNSGLYSTLSGIPHSDWEIIVLRLWYSQSNAADLRTEICPAHVMHVFAHNILHVIYTSSRPLFPTTAVEPYHALFLQPHAQRYGIRYRKFP